jgi:hypothetical protein
MGARLEDDLSHDNGGRDPPIRISHDGDTVSKTGGRCELAQSRADSRSSRLGYVIETVRKSCSGL